MTKPRAKSQATSLTSPPRVSQDKRTGAWWWKPSGDLRPAFQAARLGMDHVRAFALGRDLNEQVAAWREARPQKPAKASPRRERTPRTVSDLCGAFRASADWQALAPRTQAQYTYELSRLEAEFGHELAATLGPSRVDDWADSLRASAPETLRHVAARGRQIIAFGMRKELIPPGYNPFQKLRTGAGRHRKRLFTWEDARHCVATADRLEMPSIGTALVLAFAGVMRITDAVALEARHVANGRLVYAQSKTGAEIDAALPSVIALRLAAAPPPATRCAALCVSEQTGKPWHEKTISRVWSRVILPAAIKANPEKWRHLEGLQLRDARRSGFTWLLEKGYKVEGIVPLSGHSIQEGYEIAKHYAVNTRTRSDHASAGMDMAL